MSGLLPRRHPEAMGFVPLPGWRPVYGWQGMVPLGELPRSLTPPEGILVTANQDLNHLGRAKPINLPMGDYRARRIAADKEIEEAGADALELNVYYVATDPKRTGQDVENLYVDILKEVKKTVRIPVAIKLGPFFSAMANMAALLDEAGANGLVLFNRFYQPDIDLESLEVRPNVILSTPQALRLPLRWIAILYGRVKASLAATSGIHNAEDVLKLLMAGADVPMMCSSLLRNGPHQIERVLADLAHWMEEHEYVSVRQMKGSMSQKSVADPAAFERANYMKALQSFRPQL